MKICKLPRFILKIYAVGDDKSIIENFLQGLITNDIRILKSQNIIYTCMLNPKGRYNFDFFIFKYNDDFYIDIHKDYIDAFISKLNFYKLFHKIDVVLETNLKVYYLNQDKFKNNTFFFIDPRLSSLGYKYVTSDDLEDTIHYSDYLELCYKNAVLESSDFIIDKTIPIEVGMDELNAISYTKGCYLGQEFTNSAKRRLVIRKRIISILLNGANVSIKDAILTKNSEKVGEITSLANKYATAMVLMSYKNDELYVVDQLIQQHTPSWISHYSTL